jgi:pteridine reductase
MGRLGTEQDIAKTVYFLAINATYMTGQTIAVDGGSSNSL